LTTNNFTTVTFNSAAFEDATDYIINVTYTNATNGVLHSADTNTGVTIDNTIPTAATSLSPTLNTDGAVTFSGTVTGSRTTACTLIFEGTNPGATSYAMTHTGNSCSHALSNVPESSYQWIIRASDGTNTTDSSSQTTTVDIKTGSGKFAIQPIADVDNIVTSVTSAKIGAIPIWVIVAVILGIWMLSRLRK